MEIHMDSVQHRENCLTVVRGCVGTVLAYWDRLDDRAKKTLLETALEKTEDLVRNLEDDVKSLRLSDETLRPADGLDARRQPRPTATTS